jgi:hypothetical protein
MEQQAYTGKLTLGKDTQIAQTVTFNMARPETQMMVMFGIDLAKPLITVYHGDNQPIVELWRDGTCSIKNMDYLDEAARTFYKAVASIVKQYMDYPGWVVRKEGVSEYLQIDDVGINEVQKVHEATHFARERDAMAACRSGYEVVPAAEGMLFSRLVSLS